MTRTFLNLFDAAWFYIEKRDAPSHFGPLLILSPPEGAAGTYVGDLVTRWRSDRTFAPPFNLLLRKTPLPGWHTVPNADIDLDHHLRHIALPAPGGERELETLVSHLHSLPLDRRRPLWECHVIEGLEHGRFAIYLKLHHGQLDGVGAARLLGRILSPDPAARGMLPPWSAGIRGNGAALELRVIPGRGARHPALRIVGTLCRAVGSGALAVSALIRMFIAIHRDHTGALAGPFQSPDTVFNRRVGNKRTFVTRHYELARLKRIATAADVTVNDVFLTVFGGALRRYLLERGGLPATSVVGQLPVNLRDASQAPVGNALAFLFARLHTEIGDPLARLRAVHRSTTAAKRVQRSLPAHAVAPFTILLTGPQIGLFILGLSGRVRPSANLIVSNVPGPTQPLYYDGAPVEQIYGPSVLFHGQALNATMSSYAQQVDISFTACRRSVPNVADLAAYTDVELEELERVLGVPSAVAGQQTSA
ncbi:wax ester/triacylglycerol synthase family O-acyltransferase [Nocardia sp. NPDC059246]|uniref:WS/DGAT/MGAT family O-acyltransferase n=1 Tax=unclassified Nocardia TaxID=2637762 RepID=UPI00368CF29C